jgi:hypothetical protein
MKKIFMAVWLLAVAAVSFGQQNSSPKYEFTQTDYLKKSKKQKTIAWLFIGGGAALVVAGAVIPKGEKDGYDIWTWSDSYKNDDLKFGLITAGVLTMGGSIPFFIASGRNKRKAMAGSAFIDMEKVPALKQMQLSNLNYPVVGLRIAL